jgi:hypothetical protein
MLNDIRRAGAARVGNPHHARPSPTNSFFSKSWPLPSKYCIAIAFRIAASRSHSQFDVPSVGRRRSNPVKPLGFFLSSTPMVAWPPGPPGGLFFTLLFCVPISALNGAWIHTCGHATGRHRGARRSSGSLLSKSYSPKSKLCIVMALEPGGGHCIAMSRPAHAGRPRHRAAHRRHE